MKKLFKTLKIILLTLSFLILTIAIGIIWPMPKLVPPVKYDTVLIKSINIVEVKTGHVLEKRDVFIRENIITKIDSSEILIEDANTLVIDGTGKYLIPGLWDMHTHSNQHSPWLHHPLYIANGVTGIRDMSGQLDRRDSYWVGSKERLQWNAELNMHKRITPRYVLQSSYQIDGVSSIPDGFPSFFKIEKPEQVDSLLQFYKGEEVDFIKIYQQIPEVSYRKLARRAESYGLHIAGHKPMFLSLEEAVKLGQRSFEHGRIFMFEAFPGADSLKNPNNWKNAFKKSKKSMVQDFNPKKAVYIMELMKEKNAYWVPTLQTLKFEAFADNKSFLSNPNLKYVSWARKKLWWSFDIKNNKEKNVSPESQGLSLAFYEAAKEQVKMAHDIGVPIMTGTDITDTHTFAGFSIHNELIDLTESGLSNLEALQSATIVSAEYTKLDMQYGSVENGKAADLVLLNQNPLEDISHTSKIHSVIMNGVYYDSNKIEELKTFTESISSKFHMNVKVLYSFLNSPLIRVQFAD
ncbi:amidohydrolase family protein [Croceitalea rosinachiae]|uniref:Amidohydrolase family protein n=1 Tax=Croceitalea rosinachiae TaxID=3075596 RepID=A0ABU3AD69_9FLAO|nr:amidohydrolase family protein [Croceitalea sp. F388]MDT0607063.1 amidohydrolase family protein [Croceitalea sp. F388]